MRKTSSKLTDETAAAIPAAIDLLGLPEGTRIKFRSFNNAEVKEGTIEESSPAHVRIRTDATHVGWHPLDLFEVIEVLTP